MPGEKKEFFILSKIDDLVKNVEIYNKHKRAPGTGQEMRNLHDGCMVMQYCLGLVFGLFTSGKLL